MNFVCPIHCWCKNKLSKILLHGKLPIDFEFVVRGGVNNKLHVLQFATLFPCHTLTFLLIRYIFSTMKSIPPKNKQEFQ